MMHLFAFLLGLTIFYAAYKFGKYANEGSVLTLEGQNSFLHDQIGFLRAENDHLRKVLDRRVATAHDGGVYRTAERESVELRRELTDDELRGGPPYVATIGLCFHGVSLAEHCGQCAVQNFVAGGIVN